MAAAITGAMLAAAPIAGQTGGAPALVVTAFGDRPAPAFTAPRTPRGDPDLQGTWSSDDTAGIPLSRPQQFGNRLYLTEQEYANRQKRSRAASRTPSAPKDRSAATSRVAPSTRRRWSSIRPTAACRL